MASVNTNLPQMLENIFLKIDENRGNSQTIAKLFVELEALLGTKIVNATQYILNHDRIVIYSNTKGNRQIAEFIYKENPDNAIARLYPYINYCNCLYFQTKVLNAENYTRIHYPYTCEHVLALRLAFLTNTACIDYRRLAANEFKLLSLETAKLKDKEILYNLKMKPSYSNYKFMGSFDNIKTYINCVRAVSFGEYGIFQITEDGLRCTVEHGKCVQANLFITAACFTEYCVEGNVTFSLNLNVLNECLGIFAGIDCSFRMFFKQTGGPLILIFEPNDDNDTTTECIIKTTNYEDCIDFNLDDDSPTLNKVFVRGPQLANIFNELDKSSEEVEITLSPRRPHFKIDTLGVMQSEASIEVAKTSDMMLLFQCKQTTKARYKTALIRFTQKAMSVASKVAIKTDTGNLLEMHFIIADENRAEAYVQFYITPMINEA